MAGADDEPGDVIPHGTTSQISVFGLHDLSEHDLGERRSGRPSIVLRIWSPSCCSTRKMGTPLGRTANPAFSGAHAWQPAAFEGRIAPCKTSSRGVTQQETL